MSQRDPLSDQPPVLPPIKRVLVTGVTGYVGGRLVPRLLESGYLVRVLVRGDAGRLAGREWMDQVEVAVGDVLEPASLIAALKDVDAAYYLIHSMTDSSEFSSRDQQAAQNFAQAAAANGVQRIIYLGGLGQSDAELSLHLRSRHETGAALRTAGVPVTEFRAAIIVGSGSISFEMIRNLTERVPVMVCPRWVYTRVQPIAIRDVLAYLIAALTVPASADRIVEIGGRDVLTYGEMMLRYARVRGLWRWMLPVPFLTPRLSSYWVHLVTPVTAKLARPLIEGLRNEVIVTDECAQELFPSIEPLGYDLAVELALDRLHEGRVETVWSDALMSSRGDLPPTMLVEEQGMLIERRRLIVPLAAHDVYASFASLGGARGWPPYDWLWRLRGLMDRMVGGVGVRRGRRHPTDLRVGDAVDFWRVEMVEPDHLLLLRAEMKVPGLAWLRFRAKPLSPESTELVQTAFFAPKGLFGLLYWYSVYPLHKLIFPTMIAGVAEYAHTLAAADHPHDHAVVDETTESTESTETLRP